jgi:hypothetical protein
MEVSAREARLALPALFVKLKDGDLAVFEDDCDEGSEKATSATALPAAEMLSLAI